LIARLPTVVYDGIANAFFSNSFDYQPERNPDLWSTSLASASDTVSRCAPLTSPSPAP